MPKLVAVVPGQAAALCALVVVLLSTAPNAHADDSEVCRRARAVMSADQAKKATAEDCQRRLDLAEEDQWQLWLDLGLASEQGGDAEAAVVAYQRFVDAADARGERLADAWPRLRDEARTAIGRLDSELLQKCARVQLTTLPPGAEVTIVSGTTVASDRDRTPTVRYFARGSHTVRLFVGETNTSREITFSVEVGQTLELKVDMRPGAPTDYGIIESPGPALRGQTPGRGGESTGPGEVGKVSLEIAPGAAHPLDEDPSDPGDDHTPPPQTRTVRSPWKTIGVAATALGVGALAVGTVFLVNGMGIDDEVEACSRPGSGCSGTAPELEELARDRDVQYDRATAAFIAGGVLVVGGVITMLAFGDDTALDAPDASTPAAPSVVPFAGPDGAGVSATLRF